MSELAASIADLLNFWFGEPGSPEAGYAARRKLWFGKAPAFDQACHQFHFLYEQAAQEQLNDWQQSPLGALALILLLDQLPRNLFRNTPRAFATDAQALAAAKQAIAQGFDRQLVPMQRLFIYLPLEHSENATDQQQSVALFRALVAEVPEFGDMLDYALRHQAVIDRFGRFPHRNRILGRASTPEEIEFLKQPGSSF